MSHHRVRTEQASDSQHSNNVNSYQNASSAPVPISGLTEAEASDMEQHAGSDAGLLESHASSAPPTNWRNLASLSFSVLSGDTIWHQPRADRNR